MMGETAPLTALPQTVAEVVVMLFLVVTMVIMVVVAVVVVRVLQQPTTTGGTGDQGNGSGNAGYTSYPYPAGGGGGAGGNASSPPASDKGANGGVGLSDSITGYCCQVRWWRWWRCIYITALAVTVEDGGGDGSAYGEGAAEAGTDGRGGGGGGGNRLNSGADGGNGIVIIRYEDAADYDFDNWTEAAGAGHVFADEVIVLRWLTVLQAHRGSGDPPERERWHSSGKHNGLILPEYRHYDLELEDIDNATTLNSGSNSSAGWEQTVYRFEVPTGCTELKVTFSGDDGYIDAASLKDYGTAVWTLNEDVLASPPPRWQYGLPNRQPDDCVAYTGHASFTLDNPDGEYSPDHASVIDGFEEGMPVKFTLSTDFDMMDGDWLIRGL